jgi:DNA (cytosine-5)-methyltransferase 1
MTTIVGSLFSGIGGIDLGLERAGCEVRWQCEVDERCRELLAKRWPGVPCFDDVRTVTDAPGVDVLCGGFPCQDVSVAGRRAGLAGERSGLFHEFARLADSLAPTWVLIENVPGLMSSNDGRDMGTVLGVLADLGYGWAYRVLDAQYFGVAQRRRRVFIVGCLGDAARAAAVLLEPESCEGHPPPSREAGKAAATLIANGAGGGRYDKQPLVPALTARCGNTLDDQQTGQLVAYPLAMRGRDNGAELEMGEEGTYNALRAGNGGSSLANWVAFSENQRGEVLETDYARQVTTGGGKPGQGYPAVRQGMAVRRLTPMECERLQGFPDGWTEGFPDSVRYRMLGNTVAVPCAEWIGRRIVNADALRQAA